MSRHRVRLGRLLVAVLLTTLMAAPAPVAQAHHGPTLHDAPDGWVGTVSLLDAHSYSDPSLNADHVTRIEWTATVAGAGEPIEVVGTYYQSSIYREDLGDGKTCTRQGIAEGNIDTVLLEEFRIVKDFTGGEPLQQGEAADYGLWNFMYFEFEYVQTTIVSGPNESLDGCDEGITVSDPVVTHEARAFSGTAEEGWTVLEDSYVQPNETTGGSTTTTWSLTLDPEADLVAESLTIDDVDVEPGGEVSYTAVVRNDGPQSATNAFLQIEQPAGVTYTGSATVPLGDLAAGAEATITISGTANKMGTFDATLEVWSDTPDPDSANNSKALDVNRPPVANQVCTTDGCTTTADVGYLDGEPVVIPVLENDYDPDIGPDPISVRFPTNGASGTVECSDSACTYSPTGHVEVDNFTYQVYDGQDLDTGSVQVFLRPCITSQANAVSYFNNTFVETARVFGQVTWCSNPTAPVEADRVVVQSAFGTPVVALGGGSTAIATMLGFFGFSLEGPADAYVDEQVLLGDQWVTIGAAFEGCFDLSTLVATPAGKLLLKSMTKAYEKAGPAAAEAVFRATVEKLVNYKKLSAGQREGVDWIAQALWGELFSKLAQGIHILTICGGATGLGDAIHLRLLFELTPAGTAYVSHEMDAWPIFESDIVDIVNAVHRP